MPNNIIPLYPSDPQDAYQDYINGWLDHQMKLVSHLANELNVSVGVASAILYYRAQKSWTQGKEKQFILKHRNA